MLRKLSRLYSTLKRRLSDWRELILPGALVIGLVCCVRLLGLLQIQEWMTLDSFSRQCAAQPPSNRITLVTIDDADYQALGEFPLSNQTLAEVLVTMQQYRPRVIGFDIYKSSLERAQQDALTETMAVMPNVVAVELAFHPEPAMNSMPPAGMPPEQVGFADITTDDDGKMRRTVLARADTVQTAADQTIKYSLAVQLARKYLADEGILFQPGEMASDRIQFGDVVFPKFFPNTGGYVSANATGSQILLDFCMLQSPYETIALRSLMADSGGLNDALVQKLRDRVVIIGNVGINPKSSFVTAAMRRTLYSERVGGPPTPTKIIYGVEIQAHALDQILSSTLSSPHVLNTWTEVGEYLWIIGCGILGMMLSLLLMSPWKSVFSLTIATFLLLGFGYLLLNNNLWIPVVPAALSLCGAGLVTAFFDRDMRFELQQQRIAVGRTYEAFHNGPLQKLVVILRGPTNREPLPADYQQQLQALNLEMRSIFERMCQEVNTGNESLYLVDNTVLDLQQPLGELLNDVYNLTLAQNLPGFSTVEAFIAPDFKVFDQTQFSLDKKRGLCLFLQESLVNVGKYAIGATRVDVVCTADARHYELKVIDNGPGLPDGPAVAGHGTVQAMQLAKKLKGSFSRKTIVTVDAESNPRPYLGGVTCGIRWPKFSRSLGLRTR